MSPESSGSMGLEDAQWPDDDNWPEDDSPDDGWPDDEEDEPGPPWPGPPGTAHGEPPRRRLVRPLAVAAVAVVALGAGAGIAAAVAQGISSSPSPSSTPGNSPPVTAPGGSGGNGLFPGDAGRGEVGQLLIGGQVAAVSSTSITITAASHTVTAAVTSATRVTGKVTSIGSIKVGDHVSAQITESDGQGTATAIQDPAQLPSSGRLP